jgi:hypothetical protein
MPCTINPIKKLKVYKALKQGKSARQSLKEAGYSQATISHSTKNKVVKDSNEKIMQEVLAKDVTIDLVIKQLYEDRDLAKAKGDMATMTRVDELLGKFLAMFTDKKQIDANVINSEDQSIIDKFINSNRLPNNSTSN